MFESLASLTSGGGLSAGGGGPSNAGSSFGPSGSGFDNSGWSVNFAPGGTAIAGGSRLNWQTAALIAGGVLVAWLVLRK